MHKIKFPNEVNKTPETPGVYEFYDDRGKIIYIGKAKNLRNRIKSYTSSDLLAKTAKMVSVAKTLSYIEVQSEFEALLLEARLVRKYMPIYNIELKDDKSPLYIGITADLYPRVLTFRQTDLKTQKLRYEFGPYIDGKSAKYVLRLLRKAFPYSQHKIGKRACIYHEIGLCNPCPSVIENTSELTLKADLKAQYFKNIRQLVLVLRGSIDKVTKELVREMQIYAKTEDFEGALKVKGRINALVSVATNKPFVEEYVKNPNFVDDVREDEIMDLTKVIKVRVPINSERLDRIECFDVAHLSGSSPTASMVTFIGGVPEKKFYRHFKINKGVSQNNDVLSMKEVISRRIKHFEDWGKPDLIIIDGGKPQLSATFELLNGIVPFVGLAKKQETLVYYDGDKFFEKVLPDSGAKNLVVRMRDEAHRFARRLHHNLVTKTLLNKR